MNKSMKPKPKPAPKPAPKKAPPPPAKKPEPKPVATPKPEPVEVVTPPVAEAAPVQRQGAEAAVVFAAREAFEGDTTKYSVMGGIYEMDREAGDKLRAAVRALGAKA